MRELFQRDITYRIGEFGEVPPPMSDQALSLAWQSIEQASIQFDCGDYQLAAAQALSGIEALSNSKVSIAHSCYCRALWEIKADAYARLHQPAEAIRCGSAMLVASTAMADYAGHTLHLAISYLSLGHYHFDAGGFQDALEHYRAAADLLPSGSPARVEAELAGSLADCHANLGHLEEALIATGQTIALLSSASGIADQERVRLAALDRRAFYLAWNGQCDMALIESEGVIDTLRHLAATDLNFRNDLARCLDHRAEILERSHRHYEALAAAEESTALRRQASIKRIDQRSSLLRSIVTLARLTGHLGNTSRAIQLCEETEALMSDSDSADRFPADLRAQITTCHGRNLMAAGRHQEGENRLHEGIRLFRYLAHQGDGAAIWRDAQAEVLIDLGNLHLAQEPGFAKRYLARAVSWKRRINRETPHPFHNASLADTLVLLGHAELGVNAAIAALGYFDLAIDIYATLDVLPGGFPEVAIRVSEGIIAAARQIAQSSEQQHQRFHQLAHAFSSAIDMADDEILDSLQDHQQVFQRLWLRHFINIGDGTAIVELLSFAHGRRLALLAQSELRCREAQATLSADERHFLYLQKSIRRIDLEMAEILSARPPSSIGNEQVFAQPGVATGSGKAIVGAGRILEQQRDQLFRSYVILRDRLVAEGRYSAASSGIIDVDQILPDADANTALAVWCIPQAFDIEHRPLLIILTHSPSTTLILPMQELDEAHGTFSKLLKTWRFGRSGMRGGNLAISDSTQREDPDELETKLWQEMTTLWERLAGKLAPHGITQLHMVTHAEAHNLPWLGACPESIQLRQFPSLDFYARRRNAPLPPSPSPEHPLILLVEEPDNDPLYTLYHVPLEVEAIRQVWPGSVIEATHADAVHCSEASAIWIIGHGFSRNGFPLLGKGAGRQQLTNATIFRNPNFRTGLIYASTCYMGSTKDTSGEPIGLSGLASQQDQVPLSAGSVSPIDDLDAALLAILFHVMWRETGDATAAFHLAKNQLKTKCWGEAAQEVFNEAANRTLPTILGLASSHAAIGRDEVRELYSEQTNRSRLKHQFAIQNRGRNALRLWSTILCELSSNEIPNPGAATDCTGNLFTDHIKNTERYFSWLG
jgi:tetratricopeptide (TPR) repeat protein